MKVKCLGISDPLELLNGKDYDVAAVEGDWYRIVDETGEDYLYPPECFEIIEADGKPAEFELLRLFDRFAFSGCTTYFLGIATSRSKKAQSVTCAFHPSGHGSCFEAVDDHVESVGYATEGYALHISASCEDPDESQEPADYIVTCNESGLTVGIPAKAPAQQLVFGVSWVKARDAEGGTPAWISSDPNFIGEYWPEIVEGAATRCPECGGPLASRSTEDALGSFCGTCGWSVVTQPYLPMEDDYSTYTVRLEPGNVVTKMALSTINKLLGCGYAKAKEVILASPITLSEGDAEETLRVMDALSGSGLAFSVAPDFPHHRIEGKHGESIWSDFEDGDTIGRAGSEGGRIVYDVEFIHGARVTVEETQPIPYSITCGIYGLLVHTAFANSREEAIGKARKIQGELADFLKKPPSDESTWCEQFVEKW